jgi:NAD(P)-dependent dehydrogenase (short-subunit alcohol dehydrogenase family)
MSIDKLTSPVPQGVILVTGAASGIGEAVCIALNNLGVTVIELDLKTPKVAPTAGCSLIVDITDEVAIDEAVAKIEAKYGPISGLVNAAGILGKMHPPERMRLSDWNRELTVDLTGTYVVAKAVGCRMAMQRSGSIVNVASIAGMTSSPAHAYSAAKAGVISLTATLAQAWGRSGVRVNAVSPGFTRTPALCRGLDAGVLDEHLMAGACAFGRLLESDEVAEVILWLLSSGSRGVTGINLPVDGGFLAGMSWHAYGAK